jgi:hypothetical protein
VGQGAEEKNTRENANQGLLRRALRNESHEGEMSDIFDVFSIFVCTSYETFFLKVDGFDVV